MVVFSSEMGLLLLYLNFMEGVMGGKKKSDNTETKIVLPKDALSKVNLGQAFAEYDKVLLRPGVFVKTPALQAAEDPSRSKCFFVGRRGTGKTAITRYLGAKSGNVLTIHPHLFSTLATVLNNHNVKDVNERPFHSLVAAFRRSLYCEIISEWSRRKLLKDYPSEIKPERNFVEDYDFDMRTMQFVSTIFESLTRKDDKSWMKQINKSKQIGKSLDAIQSGPAWNVIILIDRIDDTWDGSDTAVVLLMALMHACIQIAESTETIQPMLFLRENLFQRVRQIDSEFTRIETAVVSLDWTKELLVEMIERRLQLSVNPKPAIGETWDYFFQPVNGVTSKDYILEYCQYRPRDVLMYCSFAIDEAQSHKHSIVHDSDILSAQKRYSLNRLKDAGDEYSENFPQLPLVLERFYGLGREFTYQAITEMVQKLLIDGEIQKYCQPWINENAAPHLFVKVLYNVGFFGIRTKAGIEYKNQRSRTGEMPPIDANTNFLIHPCFWMALDLQDLVVTTLNDTVLQHQGLLIELPESFVLSDYIAKIELLLKRLDDIPHGTEGDKEYEDFVGDLIKLCFFRVINNVQPQVRNVAQTTRRDWIGSNVAQTGFWEMVRSLYSANQIVWECKNYSDLAASDFQQMGYYLGTAIGNFGIVCFRGDPKHQHYYEHIQRIFAKQKGLLLLLNDADLKVFLRQAKSGKVKESHIQDRYDYTVRQIS